MASRNGGVEWETGALRANLRGLPGRVDRAVAGITKQRASIAEGWMKTNAPWTDRTGNARNGLRATTKHAPLVSHEIQLSHSVHYGIYLETRWAGRYAVITPAIRDQGAKLMITLNKVMSRLGGA